MVGIVEIGPEKAAFVQKTCGVAENDADQLDLVGLIVAVMVPRYHLTDP